MYKGYDSIGAGQEGVRGEGTLEAVTTYQIDGQVVQIDESSFIKDADFHRDGADLVLEHESGSAVVEGYFSAETAPDLVSADGSVFSGNLVQSFLKGSGEYAQAPMMNDESPVGAVQEMSGGASVTRVDGSVEEVSLGTPIYEGDIIETATDGALNIVFADDTNFAVSQDSRLSIDEYVYDPDTHEGSTDFSVLKGLFVFTSGLIGREDPDDVTIDTPQGSIGIRGTIIAGDVNTGEITVVEGAIVLRDFSGNEVTLANQFETAKFDSVAGKIHAMGELSATDVGVKFAPVSEVSGTLFSSIEDAANDQSEVPSPSNSPEAEVGDVVEASEVSSEAASESAAPAQEAPADSAPDDVPQAEAEVEAAAPEQNRSDVQDEVNGETEAVVEVVTESVPETPSQNTVNQAVESVDTALADISQKNTDVQKSLMGNRPNNSVQNEIASDLKVAQDALREIAQTNTDEAPVDNVGGGTLGSELLNPETDPNVLGTTAVPAGPSLPELRADHAPDQYFVSAEGQTWRHDFSNEFIDTQGGGLSFALAQETITQFTDLFSNGSASITDGVVELNFGTGFTEDQLFDLKIEVTSDVDGSSQIFDVSQGGGSGFEVLTFDAELDFFNSSNNDALVLNEGNFSFLQNGGDNKTVFLKNVFANFEVDGDQNEIYVGEAGRTVILNNVAEDNTVIGGTNDDIVVVEHGNNAIFTVDGNDRVELQIDEGNVQNHLGDLDIDLGHNDASYSQAFADNPTGDDFSGLSFGDVLNINGAGGNSLDLGDIGAIRGVEQIQLIGAGSQGIHLDYDDVFNITDDHNVLVVSGDSDDFVRFDGSETWSQKSGQVSLDGIDYNIWESSNGGETVTLLVDDVIIDIQ